MTTKKTPTKRAAAKKKAGTPKSMPKEGRDPKGGLTAKGRAFFNQTEGAHLRPGVQGAADTPEKMVRKGSFLRRHFAHPRGPMKDEKGEPTRLALSAHAWGEPVPATTGDARKLAATGHELLEKYHEIKGDRPAGRKGTAKKTAWKKTAAKKTAAKKTAAKKRGAKKTAAKNSAAKKSAAKNSKAGKAAGKKAAGRSAR